MSTPSYVRVVGILACVLLAGCGGGAGSLSQDLAASQAPYQVIDLQTGAVEARSAVPDLATNPGYRDRYLVVRRQLGRTATTGQTDNTFAWQTEEQLATVTVPTCYIAVFELTRAQWRHIAGSTSRPWDNVSGTAVGSGDDLPACGIDQVSAIAALDGFRSRRGLDFRLPDDATWEAAARAGATLFPWGDDTAMLTVAGHAVIADTDGAAGPQPVGGKLAGSSGCYDLVGNVAEWTSDGNLRGGSWNDPLSLARPANVRDLPPDIPHATAGVRVLYRPGVR